MTANALTERAGDVTDPLLRVQGLVMEYRTPRGEVIQAVSDVSFEIQPGETLGLVGESGCGKSTIARGVLLLKRPREGTVVFGGQDLTRLSRRRLRALRSQIQLVFQDPVSSLNPRRCVIDIVAEGLAITKAPKPWDHLIAETLRAVGLDPGMIGQRRPRELSGGQCQRVALARALVLNPALIVCDEPVSALDVSIQAQIINLLEETKERFSLSLLFIAHDLAVVKSISDRVAVMYLGKICELAASEALYRSPLHPYSQALLRAVPEPDPLTPPEPMLVTGEPPAPSDPPSGCRFRTRCPRAQDTCTTTEPALREIGRGHFVACHFPGPENTCATAS